MTNRLVLKAALRTYEHTREIKDGTLKPRTFTFEFEEIPIINRAFRRMVRDLEFHISEMAITTYICARAHGKPFTAIPVFPMRALHHGAILVNTEAGIDHPKQMEGKKVGVNRGYTVTTGVWARSILQNEYGVDLNRVTWLLSGDEHVTEYKAPPNVMGIEEGQNLPEMLISGDIPAAIGIEVDSPKVKPLIPDAEEAGFRQLREHGLYPINHTVVIRDELLEAHPDLARDVIDVFVEAKRRYVERLAADTGENTSDMERFHRRVMDMSGDPLPYGIEPNRGVLEALIQTCLDQKILTRPYTVEELFPIDL